MLHTLAYSIIALQELNLVYKFNPLYWNTACLTVNSGGIEDEDEGLSEDESKTKRATNYGKVASAIGAIRQRGNKVMLPDVNKADFGFKADIENNAIVFGLKGMNGIGDDIVNLIIQNRPYMSFDDFIERMFKTGMIKKSHIIQLIKAGSFDQTENRIDLMKKFLALTCDLKTKLTMSNLRMLIEANLVPDEFALSVRFFNFRNYISKFIYKKLTKPEDILLKLDDISLNFFSQHFTEKSIVDNVDGSIIISKKIFDKEYDKHMEKIKQWISTNEPLEKLNDYLVGLEWDKYATGSISKWEMDSLSYYYHDHELINVDKEKYGISNFFELPEEPTQARPFTWKGKQMYEYEITRIMGTVLDKNKNKHTVTLLTPEGVVTVKMYGGAFSYYDKQISIQNGDKKEVLEKSWFTRGTKLLFTGFRRGNQFIPKKYKNSIYQHTVSYIQEVLENRDLLLKTERKNN